MSDGAESGMRIGDENWAQELFRFSFSASQGRVVSAGTFFTHATPKLYSSWNSCSNTASVTDYNQTTNDSVIR